MQLPVFLLISRRQLLLNWQKNKLHVFIFYNKITCNTELKHKNNSNNIILIYIYLYIIIYKIHISLLLQRKIGREGEKEGEKERREGEREKFAASITLLYIPC